MRYFQLYIGIEREIKKFKEDLKLSSADITYFINKGLSELIDTKYNSSFDKTEELKRDLGNLVETIIINTPTVASYNSSVNLSTFLFPDLNTRFITSERVSVTTTTTNIRPVKPITIDQLNEEILDPFSEYKLRMGECKPLRYDISNGVVLVGESTYSLSDYTFLRVKNPTPFTIASASDTSEYTELPAKTHSELITIVVRQIIENESPNRYQAYNLEEIKSKL